MNVKEIYEKLVPTRYTVFLDEKGLTSSAANHQANMVKEQMQFIASDLDRTNGYTSTVFVKDKNVRLDNFTQIPNLSEISIKEGVYYGLSAWLREGITAKETAISIINSTNVNLFPIENEKELIDIEESPELKEVVLKQYTLDDALNELSLKERQEYLAVEASSAHLGKKLHPNSGTTNAAQSRSIGSIVKKDGKILELKNQLNNFRETSLTEYSLGGNTKETCVITNTALYERDDILKLFLQLQEQHRSFEERLNFYKAKLKDKMASKNIEFTEAYRRESSEAVKEYKIAMREWNLALDDYQKAHAENTQARELVRLNVAKYVAKLKIVMPEALTSISNEISLICPISK